jgi:hypothetical protein
MLQRQCEKSSRTDWRQDRASRSAPLACMRHDLPRPVTTRKFSSSRLVLGIYRGKPTLFMGGRSTTGAWSASLLYWHSQQVQPEAG